ncbi:MAG TPA: uroporphyrinogen decarboxylase [Candidatus Acidoferrales bacterium]|nr:uroporphyrinogen decarboxylase [Candidatus Acidoferrales bacterium]
MNDRFLRAARRQPVDTTPVWFMRQAGRSLPEYRKIRERWRLVDIVADPDLCAEVTLQPVRRLGVDAAVMFSDIVLPLRALGLEFDLVDGVGPVLAEPVRSAAAVDALRSDPVQEAVPAMLAAVERVARAADVPVICFSGGPFTLASYIIQGGPSSDHALTKSFMWSEPAAFDRLLARLAALAVDYLVAQVGAGAAAIQIFDSWVGILSQEDYVKRILPHTSAIFESLSVLAVPRIHFGTGTAGILEQIANSGADVVGLDWRVPLDQGWSRIGAGLAVQGNLDPALLLAPRPYLAERVREVLERAGGRPGHIFNLGHGVLPQTSPDALQEVVELVHLGLGASFG